MYNNIWDKCHLILESVAVIEGYFSPIQYPNDFKKDEDGQLRLDGIAMRLQMIGENAKKIINKEPVFFDSELEIDNALN